jgi:hypothetical protein
MNPPIVYEVTIPRSHKTTKITKIVQSTLAPYSFYLVQVQGRVGWSAPWELVCETTPSLTQQNTSLNRHGYLFTCAHKGRFV